MVYSMTGYQLHLTKYKDIYIYLLFAKQLKTEKNFSVLWVWLNQFALYWAAQMSDPIIIIKIGVYWNIASSW